MKRRPVAESCQDNSSHQQDESNDSFPFHSPSLVSTEEYYSASTGLATVLLVSWAERWSPTRRGPRGLNRAGSETGVPMGITFIVFAKQVPKWDMNDEVRSSSRLHKRIFKARNKKRGIPKGFWLKAQGCDGRATLGGKWALDSTLKGLCPASRLSGSSVHAYGRCGDRVRTTQERPALRAGRSHSDGLPI